MHEGKSKKWNLVWAKKKWEIMKIFHCYLSLLYLVIDVFTIVFVISAFITVVAFWYLRLSKSKILLLCNDLTNKQTKMEDKASH